MELNEIKELMQLFDASGCTGFKYKRDGETLELSKAVTVAAAPVLAAPAVPAAAAAPAPAAAAAQPEGAVIKAPLVGTFYAAPSPDAEPFVKEGQTVRKGETVCLLEAMKMMNEVPAPCDCVIRKVLAENGTLAEFDMPLFAIQEL